MDRPWQDLPDTDALTMDGAIVRWQSQASITEILGHYGIPLVAAVTRRRRGADGPPPHNDWRQR